MAGVVKIYWIDHELRAIFLSSKRHLIQWVFMVLQAGDSDKTKENSFDGPRGEFVYDAIICKEFSIINIHVRI